MRSKLGLIALGGLGVGFISLGLVMAVNAAGFRQLWSGRGVNAADCTDQIDAGVDPSTSERTLAWDGGDTVTISVPGAVRYRGGEGEALVVRGNPRLVSHVRAHDGRIDLSCTGNINDSDLEVTLPGRAFSNIRLTGSGPLTMENIHQPMLDISLEGNGDAELRGSADNTKVSISGSSDLTLDMTMKMFDVAISGSGDVTGKGRTNAATIKVSGSGDVNLTEMPVGDLNVIVTGSGDITAPPQGTATIDISGSGDVKLLTHPAHIHRSISGSGSVIEGAKIDDPT